jgi:hypothetical protein
MRETAYRYTSPLFECFGIGGGGRKVTLKERDCWREGKEGPIRNAFRLSDVTGSIELFIRLFIIAYTHFIWS